MSKNFWISAGSVMILSIIETILKVANCFQPSMSQERMDQILAAFDKMDLKKSGRISTADIRSHYKARNHPDYKNGDSTEKELADQATCFLRLPDRKNVHTVSNL